MGNLKNKVFSYSPSAKMVYLFLAIWSMAMLLIAIFRGSLHDYVGYQQQWKLVTEGKDPWSTDFLYGPIQNLLSLFWLIDPLGPKVFMLLTFLIINYLIVKELIKSNAHLNIWILYLVIVPFNYLIIGTGASFGLNDTLVGSLIGFAFLARYNNKNFSAGLYMSLAILLKYYPAYLLILYIFSKKSPNRTFVLTNVFTVIAGLVATYIIWGKSFINTIVFGIDRWPKPLSILWSLDPKKDISNKNNLLKFLINYNSIMLVAVVVVFAIIAKKILLDELTLVTLTFFTISFLNKGASIQYFFPLFLLLALSLIVGGYQNLLLVKSLIPFTVFISLYSFGYEYFGGYWTTYPWVRSYVGFPTFAIGVGTVFFFLYKAKSPIYEKKL